MHEGFAFRANGEYDKALLGAEKARKIAVINFGEHHMLTAHIDLLISQINVIKGNIDSSILLGSLTQRKELYYFFDYKLNL